MLGLCKCEMDCSARQHNQPTRGAYVRSSSGIIHPFPKMVTLLLSGMIYMSRFIILLLRFALIVPFIGSLFACVLIGLAGRTEKILAAVYLASYIILLRQLFFFSAPEIHSPLKNG